MVHLSTCRGSRRPEPLRRQTLVYFAWKHSCLSFFQSILGTVSTMSKEEVGSTKRSWEKCMVWDHPEGSRNEEPPPSSSPQRWRTSPGSPVTKRWDDPEPVQSDDSHLFLRSLYQLNRAKLYFTGTALRANLQVLTSGPSRSNLNIAVYIPLLTAVQHFVPNKQRCSNFR